MNRPTTVQHINTSHPLDRLSDGELISHMADHADPSVRRLAALADYYQQELAWLRWQGETELDKAEAARERALSLNSDLDCLNVPHPTWAHFAEISGAWEEAYDLLKAGLEPVLEE